MAVTYFAGVTSKAGFSTLMPSGVTGLPPTCVISREARCSIGMRLPAHCTALGKCVLAQLSEDLAQVTLGAEPYERRTDRTLTTWSDLAADLAAIRERGYSISEEEYEVGLISIAVPVHWLDGPGSGAINVSLPATRATPEVREHLTERLRQAAGEIDREIG